MMFAPILLRDFDPEIWLAIENEKKRQEEHIELIASENYVSPEVLAVQGSVLTNKYAEGYPGKRYYGGCEFVDVAETLAIERAKTLFGADYANVQPHSGSQANTAAYAAMLNPGDVVLGMSLAHGGHLTHGSPVNFSGKLYHFYSYGLHPETGEIDYDEAEKLAKKYKPKLIVTGFSAYSRVVDWQRFRDIADSIGAYMMSDIAHVAGLIATECYPSPVGIADVTTTTTHKTLRGPRGGMIMAKANPELEKKLNSAVFPGGQGGPLMHVIAAKAVAFKEALQPDFKLYQQQVLVNANVMAKTLIKRGYTLVSGGTDNHLILIDLMDKQITGKEAEAALGQAYMTTNKNAVPNDTQSPFITSGLRIGSPAMTTRGFKEKESEQVANWMSDILDDLHCAETIKRVRKDVIALCQRFPVYGNQEGRDVI
ncbi:MAG: serine hydroxymethyltransferase [Gammaproteobacteria bacterium RIFCSPHIGHO2_12_FULL_45_12]|nr:MAG: serine hydroxymethyltransferase [Gammaproteobacteria bacterium RIFCSPHIGHO2_12_FULL_45_12]